jgi:multicomponent Na+:H+ antiporter subunit D
VTATCGSAVLARLSGVGRVMPLTSFGIVLAGFSLIGVPGTAGFVSKWYLILAAMEKGQWSLVAAIVGSSLLAIAYVWRFVEVAYLHEPSAALAARREAPARLLVPAYVLVAATIYFGLATSITVGSAAGAAAMLLGGRT